MKRYERNEEKDPPPTPSKERPIERTSCHKINVLEDKLTAFLESDNLTFTNLKDTLLNNKRQFHYNFFFYDIILRAHLYSMI